MNTGEENLHLAPTHIPPEQQRPHERPTQDADNDIPVIIHRQQHHQIRRREQQRVQRRAHEPLPQSYPRHALSIMHAQPGPQLRRRRGADGIALLALLGRCLAAAGVGAAVAVVAVACAEGARDVAVVVALQAAQELEGEDEAGDAEAGAGEHGGGGDVPGGGEEAGVEGVPVPEHLGGVCG